MSRALSPAASPAPRPISHPSPSLIPPLPVFIHMHGPPLGAIRFNSVLLHHAHIATSLTPLYYLSLHTNRPPLHRFHSIPCYFACTLWRICGIPAPQGTRSFRYSLCFCTCTDCPVAYIIESHVPTFHCSVGFFTFTVFLMLPLSGLPASHVAHAKPFPD